MLPRRGVAPAPLLLWSLPTHGKWAAHFRMLWEIYMGEVWVSPTLVSLGSSCFYRVSLCSSGWPHVYQSSFLGLPGAGVKGMCLCAGPHPLMVVREPKGGTPQDYLGCALVSLDQHLVTGPFPLPRFQSRSFSGECGLCPRAQGQS